MLVVINVRKDDRQPQALRSVAALAQMTEYLMHLTGYIDTVDSSIMSEECVVTFVIAHHHY